MFGRFINNGVIIARVDCRCLKNLFWRICRRSGRSFVIQSEIFLIFNDCDVVRIELNELVDYEGLNLSNCSTGSCTTLWKLREI